MSNPANHRISRQEIFSSALAAFLATSSICLTSTVWAQEKERKEAPIYCPYAALDFDIYMTPPEAVGLLGPGYINAMKRTIDDCPSLAAPTVRVNVDWANVFSRTTFTSPTDTLKTHSDTNQVHLSGQANVGPWFLYGQVGFAGAPSGSFTDMFPAFPAANFSGNVSSGSVYNVIADGGYNFIQNPDLHLRAGFFVGYYSYSEYLYNLTLPEFGTSPLISDHWQAARVGVGFEKTFLDGGRIIDVNLNIAGMPIVQLQSGAFNGHGEGVSGLFSVSFPIPNLPLRGNVFVQDNYMKVSGSTFGVPLDVKNNNVTVGAGLTIDTHFYGAFPWTVYSPAELRFR